ncbi:hypothetical protein ACMA1D_10840 [Streptomyces sp. 796.1]|uniref:hypothetical protein n=1 Tax=Streptomyces sp. 796.1 TaxID=3163029 RepID=UPI0039C9A3A6
MIQKRDFDSGEPVFWNDGRPKMLMQVNIQTEARDPADPDDDGVRALYLEYKKAYAVRDAVKASGARAVEPGGVLALTYTGDDHAAARGRGKPPKNYSATYQPPAPGQGGADPWESVTGQPPGPPIGAGYAPPATPTPPPATVPAAAPAPAPAPAAGDPLQDFLRAQGLDPAQMPDRATGLTVARAYGYQGQ